ncbi:YggS family pyridoxal phosphate-dependent enzyme [Cellulomonas aerilata]|uniref:YggS family pyridoxal phosphate-dependent enzyme n=1 Tax=Cellulomonas aerilata TaxID=515326 RepID=UPI0011BDD966|nr:YggS family pyridoxal phosphate-dependent enzyme [Cellulomonas aerilata]
MPARDDVATRLREVHQRIAAAETAAGRSVGSVRLLLATKTVGAPAIRAALLAAPSVAHRPVLIGENRVQELVAKGPDLADLHPDVHLIGPLQSNKVNAALRWVSCVQTVDSLALATRLAARATADVRPLDVLVQVNVSGETTKSGVAPDDAVALALAVGALEGLRLRGLMTVGARSPDDAVVRAGYAVLRRLRDEVRGSGAPGTEAVTELSMGMSGDLEAAVAEGATVVRLGTAVFGSRPPVAADAQPPST